MERSSHSMQAGRVVESAGEEFESPAQSDTKSWEEHEEPAEPCQQGPLSLVLADMRSGKQIVGCGYRYKREREREVPLSVGVKPLY